MKRELIYRKAMLAILATLCFILPNASAQNLETGLHLIDMDQYHKAAVVFKELTKQNPTNADMWYYLGVCYSEIGNADSATIAFNAGLVADPKNPANLAGQGLVAHLKKNDIQAKASFLAASKLKQKKYPNGLNSILRGYMFCQFPVDDFITTVYKDAQENYPKDPNIHLNWGKILANAKDYGPSSSAYQRALLYDDKNIQAHYLLGQMYNSARNYSAALIEIDAALALDPSYVPAIREKGDAYYGLKKYNEAATWYDKYNQLTEETVSSMTRYASALMINKNYPKAHEISSKILKLDPNNTIGLRLMGWTSYETNNDADGVKAMSKFFQIRKDTTSEIFPMDYEYYAKLLMRTNQDSLAIVYFNKTLAVDSTKKREYIDDIGELYLKQKKYVNAAQYFEKSQKFRTGIDGKLQLRIGGIYRTAALQLEPLDSLQKKAFLANPTPEFLSLLVKADSAFSRVCQSNPNTPVGFIARARLANILDSDGSKLLSKPYYEKTLEVALANKPEENKGYIIESLQYLIARTYDEFTVAQKAKDKGKQAQLKAQINGYLNQILVADPGNKYATENLKLLNPPVKKAAAKK